MRLLELSDNRFNAGSTVKSFLPFMLYFLALIARLCYLLPQSFSEFRPLEQALPQEMTT